MVFEGFKQAEGVTEYYCRHDGVTLKPGYILEDAARKVLYEGKMTKQALVGARVFEFRNCTNGAVTEHEVGHTITSTYNDNGWPASTSRASICLLCGERSARFCRTPACSRATFTPTS